MYFLLYTDEVMSINELKECENGWIPILMYEVEEHRIIPYFKVKEVAKRFAERNIPNCPKAVVNLTKSSINQLLEEGFEFIQLDYPRRFDYKPSVHIVESPVELVKIPVGAK